jgi:hypothetical protein
VDRGHHQSNFTPCHPRLSVSPLILGLEKSRLPAPRTPRTHVIIEKDGSDRGQSRVGYIAYRMNSILTKTILGDTTGAMASFGPILPALADVAAQRPPRVRDWTRRDDGYETDRHDRHYDRLRRVVSYRPQSPRLDPLISPLQPSCSRRPSPAQPPPRPPSTAGPWSPPAPSPDTCLSKTSRLLSTHPLLSITISRPAPGNIYPSD